MTQEIFNKATHIDHDIAVLKNIKFEQKQRRKKRNDSIQRNPCTTVLCSGRGDYWSDTYCF